MQVDEVIVPVKMMSMKEIAESGEYKMTPAETEQWVKETMDFAEKHRQEEGGFLSSPTFASASLPKVLWYIRLWRWIWGKK
jgi:hypothetical protein